MTVGVSKKMRVDGDGELEGEVANLDSQMREKPDRK
jgi:hypothetical protein